MSREREYSPGEVLMPGINLYDQTPFKRIFRELPDEISSVDVSVLRIGASRIAVDLQKPLWKVIEDMRTTKVMLEVRHSMIAKGIRESALNLSLPITVEEAMGVETYLEDRLVKYPLLFEYINNQIGSDGFFVRTGEWSRKKIIDVFPQPTYRTWLASQTLNEINPVLH